MAGGARRICLLLAWMVGCLFVAGEIKLDWSDVSRSHTEGRLWEKSCRGGVLGRLSLVMQ